MKEIIAVKSNNINGSVKKVVDSIADKNFIHISREERIKNKFNLTHGKGKRKHGKRK